MEKRILSIFCCLIITGCLILIGIIYLSTHNRDNNRTLMGNRWSYEELSANFYRIYAADLIECCRSGQCSISDSGCNGGNPYLAFKYFVENGLVGERCKRYPVPPCRKVSEDIKRDICWLTTDHLFPVGSCRKQCDNDSEEYAQNLYRGNDYYDFWDSSIDDVKRDIVQYGPVVANIPVFEKLLDYGNEIYLHPNRSYGRYLSGHSIRLIGWDFDQNGTEYWLAANTWNIDWGEMGGFFKIAIYGTNLHREASGVRI
ncbi:hypothetical protein BLOT_016171 [Blomia tropicalis]|nr:hypothetical protein BLOT_016171 [Blomia tropicalis]